MLRRRALFLDRDGVINVDHGYVGSRERFEWMPGAREAIRAATDAGWHVFVVTNQSGVARGLLRARPTVQALHAWMADEMRRAGGTIDDLRYCPFHPEAVLAAYRDQAHPWRKPAPGMLLDLIRAWRTRSGAASWSATRTAIWPPPPPPGWQRANSPAAICWTSIGPLLQQSRRMSHDHSRPRAAAPRPGRRRHRSQPVLRPSSAARC